MLQIQLGLTAVWGPKRVQPIRARPRIPSQKCSGLHTMQTLYCIFGFVLTDSMDGKVVLLILAMSEIYVPGRPSCGFGVLPSATSTPGARIDRRRKDSCGWPAYSALVNSSMLRLYFQSPKISLILLSFCSQDQEISLLFHARLTRHCETVEV